MPLDPLSSGASAVTILDRVAALTRALTRGRKRTAETEASGPLRGVLAAKHAPPDGFELFPVNFEIALTLDIPQLTVWMLAINYTKRVLQLDAASISYFHLSGGPVLEQIPLLTPPRIDGHRARQIAFRRVLADAETRAISRSRPELPETASISVISRGRTGRKERYFSSNAQHITGWVSRPSPG